MVNMTTNMMTLMNEILDEMQETLNGIDNEIKTNIMEIDDKGNIVRTNVANGISYEKNNRNVSLLLNDNKISNAYISETIEWR